MSSTTMAKKNKGKKVADPNETSKLLAAKISQLEQDAAGEKDQEQEIGACYPVLVMGLPCACKLSALQALYPCAFRLKQSHSLTCVRTYRARGQEGHSRSQPVTQ